MGWKEDLCHKTRSRAIFFEGHGGENCSLLLGLLGELKIAVIYLVHLCAYSCACAMLELCPHVMVHTEVRKLVLSYSVALRDCLQVIRLGGKHLSPLYHLIGPGRRSWGTLDFRKEP